MARAEHRSRGVQALGAFGAASLGALALGAIAQLRHFFDLFVVRLAFGYPAHGEPRQHANNHGHDGAELPVRIHDPLPNYQYSAASRPVMEPKTVPKRHFIHVYCRYTGFYQP